MNTYRICWTTRDAIPDVPDNASAEAKLTDKQALLWLVGVQRSFPDDLVYLERLVGDRWEVVQ